MTGWVKIYRQLADDPLWLMEPFSKGQAWIDLLLLADYEDKSQWSGGTVREFKSGCVYVSQQALAHRWQWGRKKVTNFLSNLAKSGMVSVQPTNGKGTAIYILNWKRFQETPPKEQARNRSGTAKGTNEVHYEVHYEEQHLKNNKEDKEDKEVKKASAEAEKTESDVWKDGW